jgi:type I restriction enzyme S subunit
MSKLSQNKNVPELRFPEFTESLSFKYLGEILDFKNGINADKSQYGRGKKFINVLDIINNAPIYHHTIIGSVDITDKEFEKNDVQYGDILFQRSSEIREESGQSNIYLDKNQKATFGGFVIRGRPKLNFDPIYFNYLLKTDFVRKEITDRSGGSTRFNVGQDTLGSVPVLICNSSEEQEKIANFLSAVDNKLTQLRRKKELLETYKSGLMQNLFSQQIRFKQDDGTAFPDWQEKSLDCVLTLVVREVLKPSDNYLAIGIRSHMKGTFQKPDSDPNKIEMDKLYVVHVNDLIVNITFAWEGAIAIAKIEDHGGLVSHRFPTYQIKNDQSSSEYFRHFIRQNKIKDILALISPGGAGRNRVLNKKDFLRIKLFFPCLLEQQKIANCLTALDKKIEAVTQQIHHTEQFKKGLLQKMFV